METDEIVEKERQIKNRTYRKKKKPRIVHWSSPHITGKDLETVVDHTKEMSDKCKENHDRTIIPKKQTREERVCGGRGSQ